MKQILLLLLLLAFAGPGLAAENDANDDVKAGTGLPLPRFAALRTGEVNLRTGPGTRYPIDWVFVKQGLPVEITAEYDMWRRIRDSEGTEGWVHKVSLSGKRTALVIGARRELRRNEEDTAPTLAHLEPGAIGQLLACEKDWCRLKFNGIKGWLRKGEFWGAYSHEHFD